MPVQSPMPTSLPKECQKATQIFNSFASIIPQEILRGAKGFAILTIAKAGFLFSARAGTGLVIVKLSNGSWSAPSAVGTGGLGVGGQAGAELSEFVIILNSRAAVQSFMSNGSINLGGNLSVAVGPIGRNAEASGSINKFATMYSYSRTRGLFGGASLEGSVIMERNDANTKAYRDYLEDYHGDISARTLLSGNIHPPPWANMLISAIERRTGSHLESNWVDDQPSDHEERRNRGYSFGSEHAHQSSSDSPRRERYTADADEDDGYAGGYSGAGASSSDRKDKLTSMTSRFRGYSLGSVGRSKSGSGSGSNTPTRGARDRSFSSATPRGRYEVDEPESYDNDMRFSRNRRENANSGDDEEQNRSSPIGRQASLSASSRASKLTEFMKRPVLPGRKSTSAGHPSGRASGKDSPTLSRFKPGGAAKKDKNRLQYSGRYDSDEGSGYGRSNYNDDGFQASPFEERFTQVEHRFSSEVDDDERPAMSRSTRNGSSKLSRPTAKRSLTAPVPRYNSSRNDDEHDDYERYEDDDSLHSSATRKPFSFAEKFDDNHSGRVSLDSYGEPLSRTQSGSNPFEESSSAAATPSRPSTGRRGTGEFFTQQDSKDILSTLDEDLPSSSLSSIEQPMHRLDSRHARDYDESDRASIRSIDSSKEYMVVGQRAHKIPIKLKQIDNDLMDSPTDAFNTNTSRQPTERELRIATFDFTGGESGDLSFKTGEIIEVLAKDDPDWYLGRIGLQEGIIPVNRTKPYKA